MSKFATSIEAAAWDDDFPAEVEELLIREIEPAVLEIQEAVKSNTYLSELLSRVMQPLTIPAGSALAVVVSQLSSLPELAGHAFGVSVGSTVLAAQAFKAWRDKRHSVEQNQLFFYYESRNRLLASKN